MTGNLSHMATLQPGLHELLRLQQLAFYFCVGHLCQHMMACAKCDPMRGALLFHGCKRRRRAAREVYCHRGQLWGGLKRPPTGRRAFAYSGDLCDAAPANLDCASSAYLALSR